MGTLYLVHFLTYFALKNNYLIQRKQKFDYIHLHLEYLDQGYAVIQ